MTDWLTAEQAMVRLGVRAQRVRALAAEAQTIGPDQPVTARLAHWPTAPGFGHPLYPQGDPRARALLSGFITSPALEDFGRSVETATGERANIDFALVALTEALCLPEDAPFALFAVARCAGWTAHAIEQITTGALIRPRAKYDGPLPRIVQPELWGRRQRRAG